MRNLSIAKKMILTFSIIILLCSGSIAFAIMYGMRSISTSFTSFYDGPYKINQKTADLQNSIQTLEKDISLALLEKNRNNLTMYEKDMDVANTNFNNDLTYLKENLESQVDKNMLSKILQQRTKLKDARQEIFINITKGNYNTAFDIYNTRYISAANAVSQVSSQLTNSAKAIGDTHYQTATDAEKKASMVVESCFAVTIFIAIFLCMYLITNIIKPVKEIEAAAKLLAEGKLDVDVTYESKDEIGVLSENIRILIKTLRQYIFNISDVLGRISKGDMTVSIDITYLNDFAPIKDSMEHIILSLNDTLSQISMSADQVASGSEQISASSQALSQGATEQASSAEELAASISEVSDRVKQNSLGAQQAKTNMDETTNQIEQGNEQMKKLVASMNEIANTSGEIQKIIKTIDDIAFQTNILSLNAAVEAARAGEAGKGFAVVADEVRNLANKSAMAAKDTTTLIQSTIKAIDTGNKMVSDTGKYLDQISKKALDVSKLVEGIAESSEEQSTSIDQINVGVNQISSVIQTNSATAEESAASSEELSAQANMLKAMVNKFKLKDDFNTFEDLNEEKDVDFNTNIDTGIDEDIDSDTNTDIDFDVDANNSNDTDEKYLDM